MTNKNTRNGEAEDEDDGLLVPAGPVRVIVGLIVMTSSVLAAGISRNEWVKTIGGIFFLLSPFIMLKRPDKERNN